MSFFTDVFIVLLTLGLACLLLGISCRVIEMIWICVYQCSSPFICPNRRREPWPVEICNCLITLLVCIDNTLFKWCGLWCSQIGRKVKICKRKLKLCKIQANKKLDKIRVKPIVYDDVHIIVINPHSNYQIATVSKVINT